MIRCFLLPLCIALASCQSSIQTIEKSGLAYRIHSKKYEAATPDETTVKVSLWDQKAWLLNGAGETILETDIATGVPGRETPQGTFSVLERLEKKRSNRYGKYVKADTGEVVVEKAWEHRGPKPKGTVYQGINMPYWMRLTWYGVGMHVGQFKKRTRSSFGCIRVFEEAQPFIYQKTQLGTPVTVVSESLVVGHDLREEKWFSR